MYLIMNDMKRAAVTILIVATILSSLIPESEAWARRKCIVPRRGPRSGQCIDRGPMRYGKGRCAQSGPNACQWLGNRCRCETLMNIFMRPTEETSLEADEISVERSNPL